jgi:hypothetical protein
MANQFAAGSRAIACCDRCGFQFKLKELKKETVKGKLHNIMVCSACWSMDHPQLMLGMYPINDPQALRDPRPDRSYATSGLLADGQLGEGSRTFEWGWNPVGGSQANDAGLTPNSLVLSVELGIVTIVI